MVSRIESELENPYSDSHLYSWYNGEIKNKGGEDARHVLSLRLAERKRQRLRALYANKKETPLAQLAQSQ
jgi:hypothetical protein